MLIKGLKVLAFCAFGALTGCETYPYRDAATLNDQMNRFSASSYQRFADANWSIAASNASQGNLSMLQTPSANGVDLNPDWVPRTPRLLIVAGDMYDFTQSPVHLRTMQFLLSQPDVVARDPH